MCMCSLTLACVSVCICVLVLRTDCIYVHTVYALTIVGLNFRGSQVFTFITFLLMQLQSQAGEIKPCVSFQEAKLSRMVADLRRPQKFNPAKF